MYREIIARNSSNLPTNRNWWCKFFYHFSDVSNIVNILITGMLFGRKEAESSSLMSNDNASSSVISITSSEVEKYARLYFRPKTPTLYHNEGYKPQCVRKSDINASCPVPIYLFFDANKMLKMGNVYFTEKSLAGHSDADIMQGLEKFESLPFDKIYHEGYISQEEHDNVIPYRHAEVVVEGGLSISNVIKGIYCRSKAERQTLLYLLLKRNERVYRDYKDKILYAPNINPDLYFNNGIYISEVLYSEGIIKIIFNKCTKKYNYNADIVDATVEMNLFLRWYDQTGMMIGEESLRDQLISYDDITVLRVQTTNTQADHLEVEIYFDNGNLMYADRFDIESTVVF